MQTDPVVPRKGTKRLLVRTAVALFVAVGLIAPSAGSAPAPPGPISIDAAVDLAMDHVRAEHVELGLASADVRELGVTDAYRSRHNGVTHVYLTQKMDGLEVADSAMTVNVGRDGRIIHLGHRFISDLRVVAGPQVLGSLDALRAAAEHLGLSAPRAPRVIGRTGGPDRAVLMTPSGISLSPIPARLVYHSARGGDVRLAWNLEIEEVSESHWWNITIDAASGAVLSQVDYTIHEDIGDLAAGSNEAEDRDAHLTSAIRPPVSARDGSSYRVYRLPLESPNDGERVLVKNPADKLASPYGWHDNDGKIGADGTITDGNNVRAYADYTGVGNSPLPAIDTDGGEALTFDFDLPPDGKVPHLYRDAAVTNLFYWNNIIHDVLYRYGFDESSGNFQVHNYGRGGKGKASDSVRAEAQDHGGVNNANFATPPDGSPPRMQMFLWPNTPKRTILDGDFDSGVIIHEYVHGVSNRLTGGPSEADCLRGIEEQAGEGWSDWISIAMTALPGDRGKDARGMGTWVLGQAERTERGIRPTPYSTNMIINPSTYKTITTAAAPHGVGYVWASMLWEVYWNLVDRYGFNPNPYGPWQSGGNNLAIQLVIDGMKFQPCKPGFVDARDAILAADDALTGGANRCEIWAGFAKRGLGYRAKQKDPASKIDGVEDFTTHPAC